MLPTPVHAYAALDNLRGPMSMLLHEDRFGASRMESLRIQAEMIAEIFRGGGPAQSH